jgi:hypothetical protein
MFFLKNENQMKTIKSHWIAVVGISAIVVATPLTAFSQTAPALTIAPLGTNQFLITVANGYGGADYDLLWTPVLGNPDYPWTYAAVGTTGQTNFLLNMGDYKTGFFLAQLDTNGIPFWEAADPNNPGAGILAVFIDSPTNNAVLQ